MAWTVIHKHASEHVSICDFEVCMFKFKKLHNVRWNLHMQNHLSMNSHVILQHNHDFVNAVIYFRVASDLL